jgi:hypothetical protein
MKTSRSDSPLSRHEVVDRAYLACEFFDYVASHEFTKCTPELKARAKAISRSLAEFYQLAAQIDHDARG